jgi:hypothetical protein
MSTMTAAQMKDKIEKLLAKAERTDNDHERDAFTAQAQKLMLKYGIEEADLEARGEVKREDIVEEHRLYRGAMADAMCTFAHQVALGMGNLRTFKTTFKATRTIWVIGHTTDVSNFWMLMNSLELQVAAARRHWVDTDLFYPELTKWEQHKAQRQFTMSFGTTCGNRLRKLRTEVQAEATPGAALVLVSKQEAVDEYTDNRHNLRSARGISGGHGGSAGRDAGNRANLGGKGISGGAKGQLR